MKGIVVLCCWIFLVAPLRAQNEGVTADAIPAGATKVERQDRQFQIQEYYAPGAGAPPENLVARETFYESKLLRRELFKNNRLHGVQRSWNTNGQLSSEEPYLDGVRHGVFRRWDECGRLIAQYSMQNGNGTARVYDEEGKLRSEESFKDNRPDGLRLYRFVGPEQRAFGWFKNGKPLGGYYDFYMNGDLSKISLYSKSGNDGYKLTFDEDGALKSSDGSSEWFLAGKPVVAAEYSQAAKANPELPPYFSDAAGYRNSIPVVVRAAERTYREMPPVKIPLQFDTHGNPRLLSDEDKRREVLEYSIPADAKNNGPLPSKDYHEKSRSYFLPDAKVSRRNIVARETYYDDVLIERQLYYPNCKEYSFFETKHGVQREWYPSGQLKSESPYWHGTMDGTFRHWDDQGRLIGQYEIHEGDGTALIYHSDGVLERAETFVGGRNNGVRMQLLEDGRRWFLWFKRGKETGASYLFYPEGELSALSFHLDLPYAIDLIHGPYLSFDKNGNVTTKAWYVKNDEVSEAEYSKVASADPTLPPYLADARQYQKYLTPQIKALAQKYRVAPKVKIPLEFDVQGRPRLAP